MGSGVHNGYRLNAVEAQRQVVGSVSVRLYKGNVNVEVRSHGLCNLELVGLVFLAGKGYPFAGNDACSVLKGYKCVAVAAV